MNISQQPETQHIKARIPQAFKRLKHDSQFFAMFPYGRSGHHDSLHSLETKVTSIMKGVFSIISKTKD